MKINGSIDPRLTGNGSARAELERTDPAAPTLPADPARPASPSATGAEASVSSRARLMQRALAEFERTEEFRADTVNLLRQTLDAGRYQVDVSGLAERLLHLVQ